MWRWRESNPRSGKSSVPCGELSLPAQPFIPRRRGLDPLSNWAVNPRSMPAPVNPRTPARLSALPRLDCKCLPTMARLGRFTRWNLCTRFNSRTPQAAQERLYTLTFGLLGSSGFPLQLLRVATSQACPSHSIVKGGGSGLVFHLAAGSRYTAYSVDSTFA